MMGGALASRSSQALRRPNGRLLASGTASLVALNGGYGVAFAIGAVFAATAALLSFALLRVRLPAPAHEGERALEAFGE